MSHSRPAENAVCLGGTSPESLASELRKSWEIGAWSQVLRRSGAGSPAGPWARGRDAARSRPSAAAPGKCVPLPSKEGSRISSLRGSPVAPLPIPLQDLETPMHLLSGYLYLQSTFGCVV